MTDGDGARVFLVEGDELVPKLGAQKRGPAAYSAYVDRGFAIRVTGDGPFGTALREQCSVATDDILEFTFPDDELPAIRAAGIRSYMVAPLGHAEPIAGILSVVRIEVRPFDATEMATLEAFANQAAVAIATARSQAALAERNRVLADALERETASADILRIISQSPGDVENVLAAIGRAAMRLCEADHAAVAFQVDGKGSIWDPIRGIRATELERLASNEVNIAGRVEDWGSEYARPAMMARADGLTEAAVLVVPLSAPSGQLGFLIVRRHTARAFGEDHVTLLRRFADQAVIAIENARVFNELQARNKDVAEALERQTATAEVLEVISREPANLQAALDAVVLKASRLLNSDGGVVIMRAPDGTMERVALVESGGIAPHSRLAAPTPAPSDPGSEFAALIETGKSVARNGGPDNIRYQSPNIAALWQAVGINASIVTPLTSSTGSFGLLAVSKRSPEAYTETQIRLFETFAAQAVIAIENAQLFNALQARNREITEALRREEATGDILRQISRAPEELDETLQAIADATTRLTGLSTALWMIDGQDAVLRGRTMRPGDSIGGVVGARLPIRVCSNESLPHNNPTSSALAIRWTVDNGRCWRSVFVPAPWSRFLAVTRCWVSLASQIHRVKRFRLRWSRCCNPLPIRPPSPWRTRA